jgi:hypothetical protein
MMEMQSGIYITKVITDGTYKPSRRRMLCDGIDVRMASVCAPDGLQMGAMWCVMTDPKGVGVLTTRRRYSRERHRQKSAFSPDPLGYSYPLSIINP